MFETIKTFVFSQDAPFDTKPVKVYFLLISGLILEAFWEPGLLTFCFLVAPVTNACMFFGSKLTSLIFSVKSDVEESRNGGQGWLMVEVGGRSGASGGRGRLRLRALKGFVSHVQHALLPLDEVRRIDRLPPLP